MSEILVAAIQPPFPREISQQEHEYIFERGMLHLQNVLQYRPSFVLLPEYFNVFGLPKEKMYKQAEHWKLLYDKITQLSKQYKCYIILPMIIENNGQLFNRTFVINDEGLETGFYDKTHLTISERDKLNLTAGNELKCFQTGYGKVAIAVCYEIYFPQIFSTLWKQSPEIIFQPSLQRSEHELASEVLLKARAMDVQAYIMRSSFGQRIEQAWTKDKMFGQSCIVHPDGTILANAGHYEGFAIASIQLPFVWKKPRCSGWPEVAVRKYLMDDSRGELYQ